MNKPKSSLNNNKNKDKKINIEEYKTINNNNFNNYKNQRKGINLNKDSKAKYNKKKVNN